MMNEYDISAEEEWNRLLSFVGIFSSEFIAKVSLYNQIMVPDWNDFLEEVADHVLTGILENPEGNLEEIALAKAEAELELWLNDVLAVHRTRLEG